MSVLTIATNLISGYNPLKVEDRTFTNQISAIVAEATSGDTIILPYGTYYDWNFLKNGVKFVADGPVTLINNGVDVPFLSDEATLGTGADTSCDFFGPFLFRDTQTPATAGRNHGIIQLTRANSRVRLFDITGMSSEPANTTGNPCCVHVSAGTVEVFGAGTYLDSTIYDPVIMKPSGSGTFRAHIDRFRADTTASGNDGNCLEIGSGNTCEVFANSAVSSGSVAMRLNGTCFIDIRKNIEGVTGGVVTNTGAAVTVRAHEIKATGSGILTYAILHQAGTLAVDARRVVCTGTDDVAALVNAQNFSLMNAAVVVSGSATESIGTGGSPFNVLFRNCFSNKALSVDITALIASNYTVDTDIS